MNTKPLIRRLCFLFVGAVALSGCLHIIKTSKIPVDEATLHKFVSSKPVWTIEDQGGKTRVIGNVAVRADSVFGKLEPMRVVDHPNGKLNYGRSRSNSSLSYLHLKTAQSIDPSAELAMPVSAITSGTIHEKNYLGSTVANLAILGASVAVIAALCNCPYIETVGRDTTILHGALFPGAISKSLEREDNLILNNVAVGNDGRINIRISNRLPEIEYFNKVELFEVTDMAYRSLAQHVWGHPVTFNAKDNLLSAVSDGNNNIKHSVESGDEVAYDFVEEGYDDQLNQVILTFDRTQLGDNAILVVKAKQSKWMEAVGEFTARQFGTAFDNWTKKLDKVDPEKFKESQVDRGISMNTYISRNGRWEYIGSYTNVGTSAYRMMVLNVDLHGMSDASLMIKLETAFGFWDLDYVGLTDEWSHQHTLSKLDAISAVNQSGENVVSSIAASDASYTELAHEGDFIDLHFPAPRNAGSLFILRGNGFYHHERNYVSKPNYRFLNAVRRDKMTSHQLSMMLRSRSELQASKTDIP